MKTFIKSIFFLMILGNICSCSSDDEETDTEKPTITVNYAEGFPKSCTVLQKGNPYIIKVKAADNVALASYAIDIHHNFDHHTHDDQGAQCTLDPIKTPKSPMIFMENYPIKGEVKQYEITQSITIPEGIDAGDYHCQISVIDVTGWQSRTSIDIKIQ
ncbi:DUF4625 domain-containing protein [Aquimarina aquimarini]|uniref:DUF4625 domain-containing protein n=1 Tax=Aquimarina aquimarini TaxID=1191734 RepID=UPI000D55E134|nr:DUF4625 domain-containing protein [Aquimarina aquimarini]